MYRKMDLNEFNEIFKNNGWYEAIKYKDKFIPKTLYKYYPLFDERYVEYKNENGKKINTVKESRLWITNYKNFNDPFEFKMLSLDLDRLSEENWEASLVEDFLSMFKDRTLVTCFASEVENNMPMWAHYANNHRGYCVEYSVLNPRTFFQVQYEPKRSKSAVIPTMIISEIINAYNKGMKKPTDKFYEYFTYLYMSFCCKHDFWKYENEYRLLYQENDVVSGRSITLEEAGLKIEAIYIGYNCEDDYEKKLIDIGNYLGCSVYKMEFEEYSDEFKLKPQKIR